MFFDTSFPGRTRFVPHAVREIRNRLPDYIAGSRSSRVEYVNRLDALVDQFKRSGLIVDGEAPIVVTQTIQTTNTDIPVPHRIFRSVCSLLKDHIESREKSADKAFRLFRTIAPENHDFQNSLRPIVLHWVDVTDWFMRRAHDSGILDNDVDEAELKSNFELFEVALGAMICGFFKTIEDLDEILEDANS